MDEKTAIFTLGKKYSILRNFGKHLPSDLIEIGNSWVLPSELADEYDTHFPPGPRKYRQKTNRKFTYTLNSDQHWDYRGELLGLKVSCENECYHFLEKLPLLTLGQADTIPARITTTRDNRYDHLDLDDFVIVIDKLHNQASIQKGRFRIDSVRSSVETPMWGDCRHSLEFPNTPWRCQLNFPFCDFDHLWKNWENYAEFRRLQISEAIAFGNHPEKTKK